MPWSDDHVFRKERALLFWHTDLGLESIGDAEDVLTNVEVECRKIFDGGNCGKTVTNKV